MLLRLRRAQTNEDAILVSNAAAGVVDDPIRASCMHYRNRTSYASICGLVNCEHDPHDASFAPNAPCARTEGRNQGEMALVSMARALRHQSRMRRLVAYLAPFVPPLLSVLFVLGAQVRTHLAEQGRILARADDPRADLEPLGRAISAVR